MKTIIEELQSLGETADEIAANLLKLGITGYTRESDMCPIANYLQQKGYDLVSVDNTEISYGISGCELTPNPIAEFVDKFDNGIYPKLIK